jgi:hypothetical protein
MSDILRTGTIPRKTTYLRFYINLENMGDILQVTRNWMRCLERIFERHNIEIPKYRITRSGFRRYIDMAKNNDIFFCEICHKREPTECHHWIPISMHGTNHPLNLVLCCAKCHIDAHHYSTGSCLGETHWQMVY